MSHEVETMAYVGEVPWHGLGTPLGDEGVDAEQMWRAAQLDWGVDLHQLYVQSSPGQFRELPGMAATVRDEDSKVLGVVSDRYQTIQNREMFDFAEQLALEGDVTFHTAGSLFGGRRVWALARLPNAAFEVVPGDRVEPWLCLASSHDGSMAFSAFFTAVRVVCNNTFRAALYDAEGNYRPMYTIRHTGKVDDHLEEARRVLGLLDTTSMYVREAIDHLASQAFS